MVVISEGLLALHNDKNYLLSNIGIFWVGAVSVRTDCSGFNRENKKDNCTNHRDKRNQKPPRGFINIVQSAELDGKIGDQYKQAIDT